MSTYRVVVLTVGRDCEAKWSKPEIKPVVVAQALYIVLLSIVHSVARGGLNISTAPQGNKALALRNVTTLTNSYSQTSSQNSLTAGRSNTHAARGTRRHLVPIERCPVADVDTYSNRVILFSERVDVTRVLRVSVSSTVDDSCSSVCLGVEISPARVHLQVDGGGACGG